MCLIQIETFNVGNMTSFSEAHGILGRDIARGKEHTKTLCMITRGVRILHFSDPNPIRARKSRSVSDPIRARNLRSVSDPIREKIGSVKFL